MQSYTDKYGARCINLEHYRIRIRKADTFAYCVNAGRTADDYMDDVATYVTAADIGEAETRALELLREHVSKIKTEVNETLAELDQITH